MPKPLMPRLRDPLVILLSLLLAVSTVSPSKTGNVAAAGSITNSGNHNNYMGFERSDANSYEDENSEKNADTERNNGNESSIDPNNIPPVYFSLLPISDTKGSNTEVHDDDDSSILNLTLYFTPMFPTMSRSNPLLRNVYKAYHAFEEGPIDAKWATFQGGPPGLARTKCTIEGHDDFRISNFMRVGETRVDISGADYILCLTTL